MRIRLVRPLFLLLSVLLLPSACDDGGTEPKKGISTLSLYLTDAPGEVANVWVELLALTAQGGDGEPVQLLSDASDLVLLTDLVGTAHLLGVETGLNPTTFRQLRLVIGDAVLEASDGSVYVKRDPDLSETLLEPETVGDLQCPSCSQSGIKVKVPNDEVELEEGAAALVLDFDVAQSFGHKAGNSGKWVMRPVILGTLVGDVNEDGNVLDELGLVGSISGTVVLDTDVIVPECPEGNQPTLVDFVPTATLTGLLDGEGQPIVRAGTVSEGGEFLIGFLPSGTYTMGFVSPIDLTSANLVFTADVNPDEVTVSQGEEPSVTYTIRSAECQATGG
jgi:hypothetical protein